MQQQHVLISSQSLLLMGQNYTFNPNCISNLPPHSSKTQGQEYQINNILLRVDCLLITFCYLKIRIKIDNIYGACVLHKFAQKRLWWYRKTTSVCIRITSVHYYTCSYWRHKPIWLNSHASQNVIAASYSYIVLCGVKSGE